MKVIVQLIAALALALPVGLQAQERQEKSTTTTVQTTGRHEGHPHFEGRARFGEHRHFRGFRGHEGRFDGWRGGFYGEVIVLDDGCYIWTPPGIWILNTDCD